MPLKIVRRNHVDVPGRGFTLLTTPHAVKPGADLYMGQIVEDAALLSKSFAVIGKAGREFAEPCTMHLAQSELSESIHTFLREDGLRCILDIRGKKEPGVCMGSAREQSASQSTMDMIRTRLTKDFSIEARPSGPDLEPGGLAAIFPEKGLAGNFLLESMRIEFGLEEKTLKSDRIIQSLADIVRLVNEKVGYSESKEGAGNILD